MVVFLGAVSACLWSLGTRLHHAYAAAIACHPVGSAACSGLVARFNGMDNFLANGTMLQAVPPLIGAFVGATVLARELESGSFRFSWTQGFVRWRWALAKLVGVGIVVAVAVVAFSALTTWYYQPYFASGNQAHSLSTLSPFETGLFDVRGVALAAWTVVAFAIGGLAGLLVRRVVPAIVATLVAYAGLAFAVGALLRRHYLAPLVTDKLNVPSAAWILSQWGTTHGKVAFTGSLPPTHLIPSDCFGGQGKPSMGSLLQCISQHGYTLWTSYQPDSRFWSFQWIEGGGLLVLSALLIAATVWLVRRRAA
jgi:hypothetical protein